MSCDVALSALALLAAWISLRALLGAEDEAMASYSDKSLERFKRAAENREAEAAFLLGVAFQTGRNAPMDTEMASECFRLAANGGHPKAKEYIDTISTAMDAIPSDLPRQTLIITRTCTPYHGIASPKIWTDIHLLNYHNGTPSSQPAGKPIERIICLLNLEPKRMHQKGILHLSGIVPPPSEEVAYRWIKRAAISG